MKEAAFLASLAIAIDRSLLQQGMVFLIAVCKSFVVSDRRASGACKVSIRLLKRMDYVELRECILMVGQIKLALKRINDNMDCEFIKFFFIDSQFN